MYNYSSSLMKLETHILSVRHISCMKNIFIGLYLLNLEARSLRSFIHVTMRVFVQDCENQIDNTKQND